MTTLAANKGRVYEFNEDNLLDDVPIVASDTVYEGAAVGEDTSTGNGRPLVAGDNFMGFAAAKTDNESGSAGDKVIRVRKKGNVKLDVTGVTDASSYGATVYASDDDTFTLTVGSNSPIGKVGRHVSGSTVMVRFEAVQVQSL